MKLPPNSRWRFPGRSGQPIVWITRLSGFGTSQTSFTPSAYTCGREARAKRSEATPARCPCGPLGEDRHPGADVGAWLEVRQLLAVLAAAPVAGADAHDAPAADEERARARLGDERGAGLLRLLGEPAADLRERGDVVVVVPHRRRRGDAQVPLRRQEVDALAHHRRPEGHVLGVHAGEELPKPSRVDDHPGEQVSAGHSRLLDDRDGDVAELVANGRMLLEELPQPDGRREPGWTAADDQHADVDALVGRVGRLGDEVAPVEGRRKVGGADAHGALIPCAP